MSILATECNESNECNEIIECNEYKCTEIIGRGAFGTVIRDSNNPKNVIKVGKDTLTEFLILECIMIQSLNPNRKFLFMSYIKDVELINGSVAFVMDDYGLNLMKYGSKLRLMDRILLIEPILLQFSKFLMFLKTNKIIHMDIKGENICVNKHGNLIFIDWGFAGLHLGEQHQRYADCYVGTHSHADPKYIKSPTKINPAYDVFAMAMTIISFIRQKTIDLKKDINESLTMDMNILLLYQDIYKLYGYERGSKYVEILNSMLELDESKRITAEELYSQLYNAEYTPISEPMKDLPIKYLPNSTYDRKKLYSEISRICVHYKITHLCDYIIYLYEKLDGQIYINSENYTIYITSCILIANWTIHHHSGKIITLNTAINKFLSKYSYSREDLIDIILTNVKILKYYILKFDFSTITPLILIETETQTDSPEKIEAETQTDSPEKIETETQTDHIYHTPEKIEADVQTDHSPDHTLEKNAPLLQRFKDCIHECIDIKMLNNGIKRYTETCYQPSLKRQKIV